MALPFDDAPPAAEGRRIKPSIGWLTTEKGEAPNGAPDGSISIEVVHVAGKTLLQQVRHYRVGTEAFGDSILLDRETLRPFKTWRWTPRGTYVTRYLNREVERFFYPIKGGTRRSIETMDVAPYSALGMELLVSALPLGDGYHGMVPVALDTAPRGWTWLHFEVQREMSLQERPDQREQETWIVDCDMGPDRTRLWIATDGRSVRKIERLNADNQVVGVLRRTLLHVPAQKKGD